MLIKKMATTSVLLLSLVPNTSKAAEGGSSATFYTQASNYFSTFKASVVVMQEASFEEVGSAPRTTAPTPPTVTPPTVNTWLVLEIRDRATRKFCRSATTLLPSEFVSDGAKVATLRTVLTRADGGCVGPVELTWRANGYPNGLIFNDNDIGRSSFETRVGERKPYSASNDVMVSGMILHHAVEEPCFSSAVYCLYRTTDGIASAAM